MSSGIYCLWILGRPYVGSSKDIPRRLNQHTRLLEGGKHPNGDLQAAFNEDATIEHEVLEFCDEVELLDHESMWIEEKRSYVVGFNQTAKALKSPIHTTEQRRQSSRRMIAMNKKSGWHSDTQRLQATERCKAGLLNTPEQRRKASERMTRLNTGARS